MKKYNIIILALALLIAIPSFAQRKKKRKKNKSKQEQTLDATQYNSLKFRNIGPFRGGRSNAVSGVVGDPMTYYMGSTGGGVWKTTDAGVSWKNISDGFFKTGSVGAIAVSESDPNVIYVGMGEHAIRGVMTSHGDGVYKSVDAGKTWKHLGLPNSRHIARIRIHPTNTDIVYVAVQGAAHGESTDRGIYKSIDGGQNWKKTLFVDGNTGASDISMDVSNPRILYASTWEHRRFPWTVQSGGAGSGFWKSTDSGETWERIYKGFPDLVGKTSIDVSRANPNVVYAIVEAEPDKGGVYRSNNGGKSFKQVCKDRVTIARSWYYMEIFADPMDENIVYVMNAPYLKSIDGGKTFKSIPVPHGDQHDMWINPTNNKNIINANDGGANVSFNDGASWSSQQNQPTSQFYRVIADNRFPYFVYGGQQDNSTVAIASRTNHGGITWKDWYAVSGCESAFLAFDPNDPRLVYGGCYQGNISVYDHETETEKDIMAYPFQGLSMVPKDMKYRFNWNAPIVASPHNWNKIYHGGNKVLMTTDEGQSWKEISPDLTRNDTTKHGPGGIPITIEAAGGENYNTISYMVASPHADGELWVGSDDGLLHLTKDDGGNWENITPKNIGEALINAIEVSPHTAGTAYIAVTKYKFNDFTPMAYKTTDYGKTWTEITNGFGNEHYVRVIREDTKVKGLLYAGTELALYVSFNDGENWHQMQLNLPVCPITDLFVHPTQNDLIVATSGRAFWILDDLTSIQGTKGKFSEDKMQVFTSKKTLRYNAPSPSNPKTMGANRMNGVIIDYYLPNAIGGDTVLTLEIVGESGNVVRTFTNQKPEGKPYFGGPSAKRPIKSSKGLHRIGWDMRSEGVVGIQDVFVFGGYNGGVVPTGDYTLRLSSNGETVETTFTLAPDPKLKATPADYKAQFQMMQNIEKDVIDIHKSVSEMREVQSQLTNAISIIKLHEDQEELIAQGENIQKLLTKWESNIIQTQQKTFQDVINFPNKLNTALLSLKSRIDGHDPRLTAGAKARYKDLKNEWTKHKLALNFIIEKEILAFNERFEASGISILKVPRRE